MNSTTAGVRKTEEYVYQSLHWAFPMVPLLVVSHTVLNPSITSIALFVTALVASASGLAVLHTRLRDADLLPASRWDRFRTTNLGAVEAVWAVTSAAAAVLQSTSIGRPPCQRPKARVTNRASATAALASRMSRSLTCSTASRVTVWPFSGWMTKSLKLPMPPRKPARTSSNPATRLASTSAMAREIHCSHLTSPASFRMASTSRAWARNEAVRASTS